MPKFSIIVPVYNVEKYLKECLNSIIEQSYQNIEIIVVDDGSRDNSGQILDKYAAKDNRIIAIHQQNAGVSAARNAGLDIATGEYICFVDGDDMLMENAYKELAAATENSPQTDIFAFSFCTLSGTEIRNKTTYLQTLNKYASRDCSKKDFIWELGGSVWTKIYKRSFLEQNHIRFARGIPLAEDGLFCTECAIQSPKVTVIPQIFYIYRIFRENSTMSSQHGLDKEILCRDYMINQPYYQNASREDKFIMDIKICMNLLYRYSLLSYNNRLSNLKYLQDYQTYLISQYTPDELNKEYQYLHLIRQIKLKGKERISFLQQCFSIKNTPDKRFKEIRILGIKFHLKRKTAKNY